MLMRLSKWLTAAVLSDLSDKKQRTLCEYGCELWLYTCFSTLGLLAIGLVFGAALETMIIIAIFYLCQSNGGGYHANTHIKCFLTMTIGLLISLLVVRVSGIHPFLILACSASILVLLAFPLCLHTNKQFLKDSSQQLKLRSRLVTIGIMAGISVLGIFDGGSIFYAGCIAVLLSAVSRLYATCSAASAA